MKLKGKGNIMRYLGFTRIALFFILIIPQVFLADITSYPSSVAVTDNALSIFTNPSALGIRKEIQFFGFLTHNGNIRNKFCFSLMSANSAFGLEHMESYGFKYNIYNFGIGFSVGKGLNLGFNYKYYSGVKLNSEINIGFLQRPFEFLSIGGVLRNVTEANYESMNFATGVGVRPLGNWLTIAGDIEGDFEGSDFSYKIYAEIKPVNGISLFGEYRHKDEDIICGLNLNLLNFGGGIVTNIGGSEIMGDYIHFTNAEYRTIFKGGKKKIVIFELPPEIDEEPSRLFFKKKPTLKQLIDFIDELAKDKDIEIVVFKGDRTGYGYSKLYELRRAISRLKKSGKTVIYYGESFNNSSYYLSSICDSIYINPAGTLWLVGMSTTSIFIKDLLTKIGIEAEFEKIGRYKTAADMLTSDTMSIWYREMVEALLDDYFNTYLEEVSISRNFTKEELKNLIDNGPYMARDAKVVGLVTDCLYEDQVIEVAKKIIGKRAKPKIVEIKKYRGKKIFNEDWVYPEQRDKIALIYAVGSISQGKSREDFDGKMMGSVTIAKAIKSARKDKTVKAIVFRIDSPGGSALASDIIWREIYLTTTGEKRKPFIVSMSSVAGSGGYYIACQADTIIATPYTVTGSIGVLGGKLAMEKLFDKMGVNSVTIKRGKYSDYLSIFRKLTEDEREKLKDIISDYYEIFTKRVAEGRNIMQDSVKAIGEGRIWSGLVGRNIGIVDVIGDLKTAIEIAKEKGGLKGEETVIKVLPKHRPSLLNVNIGDMFVKNNKLTDNPFVKKMKHYEYLFNLWLNNDENIFMIMPYIIEIE